MKRIWAIHYRISGRWQHDGEWYGSERGARSQAQSNVDDFQWEARVQPYILAPAPARRGARKAKRGRGKGAR